MKRKRTQTPSTKEHDEPDLEAEHFYLLRFTGAVEAGGENYDNSRTWSDSGTIDEVQDLIKFRYHGKPADLYSEYRLILRHLEKGVPVKAVTFTTRNKIHNTGEKHVNREKDAIRRTLRLIEHLYPYLLIKEGYRF